LYFFGFSVWLFVLVHAIFLIVRKTSYGKKKIDEHKATPFMTDMLNASNTSIVIDILFGALGWFVASKSQCMSNETPWSV
jgi:hypothetical protein